MNLSFDPAVLRPLVEQVVLAVLERVDDQRMSARRLAYSEAEAAAMLGVQRHVLRDARLRGEIVGCRVGKGVRYAHDELLQYLQRRREL